MIAIKKTLLLLIIFNSQEPSQIMVIQMYFQENIKLMVYIIKKVININHIVLEEVKIDSSKLLILSFMELTSNYLMINKLKGMQLMLNQLVRSFEQFKNRFCISHIEISSN